jgi:PhnB protein
MQLEPYLHFDGACEEALNFYRTVFGGEIVYLQRYAGSPAESRVPDHFKTKVMHATYHAPTFSLMAADSTDPGPQDGRITLSLGTSDEAEAGKVFAGLSEGGEVTMPLEKTFWAKAFGMVTDRYGVVWMVNCS